MVSVGAHSADDGGGRGVYNKRHLVPFGEYLPFRNLLKPVADRLGVPAPNFSPGAQNQEPLVVAGHPVGVSVCYEIAFGAEIARDAAGVHLLVTVSNDAWFGSSAGPHQHLQIARARALETGRWLVRATNTGITAVVSPAGEITARLPQFESGTLADRVIPRRGVTPYVRFGDWPVVAMLCVLIAAIIASPGVAARGALRSRPPGQNGQG